MYDDSCIIIPFNLASSSFYVQRTVTPNVSKHHLTVVERAAAQWTSRSTTRPEPLEQTATMETILASSTLLSRQLAILGHNTVADRAFRLALQRAHDILSPSDKSIDDVVV